MTETAVNNRSFYDHTHPDTEYFGISVRGAAPEPAVEDVRTDPMNIPARDEHGPPGSD